MTVRKLQPKLILFDMDRTLIKLAQWYDLAYLLTVRAVFGLELPGFREDPSYAGNTLANIFRSICHQAGVDRAVVDANLSKALATLSDNVIRLLPADLRLCLMPGAELLLSALHAEGQALGLVTGTDTAIVQTILERSGLEKYFPIYACGDEGENKAALARLAIERALRAYPGLRLDQEHLVMVGDAPRDIEAGKAAGAWTVAVATGFHPPAALASFHPDVVLPSLEDRAQALQAILGAQRHSGQADADL